MYPYDNNPTPMPNYYQNQVTNRQNYSFSAQPQQQNQNQNDPSQVVFYYVQNRTAAENWLLGKNERLYLMDSSEPVMYLKATDQEGRYYPMRTFDLVERKAPVQGPNEALSIDTTSFVKRDEITALVAKAVEEYLNTPAKKEA